jgi:hypothetical protein
MEKVLDRSTPCNSRLLGLAKDQSPSAVGQSAKRAYRGFVFIPGPAYEPHHAPKTIFAKVDEPQLLVVLDAAGKEGIGLIRPSYVRQNDLWAK